MIANRDQTLGPEELSWAANAPFMDASERETFLFQMNHSVRQKIVIHELLGHGTGKLLSNGDSKCSYYLQYDSASYNYEYVRDWGNFDLADMPISPLTGQPIKTWYGKGETYSGVFGELATSMEECRAECVGAFLIFEKELLAIFGYTDSSEVKANDCRHVTFLQFHPWTDPNPVIYNLYLHLGVLGLEALLSYNPKNEVRPSIYAGEFTDDIYLEMGPGT